METNNNLTQEQNDFINKASFAGFLGPWYALASGLYREFWLCFIPGYNIYVVYKLIRYGRKMAWEKSNKDYEHFYHQQKNLSKVMKILLLIGVGILVLEIVLFAFLLSGKGKDVAKIFTQNVFTTGDISSYVVSDFELNQEYINKEIDTRGIYESVFFDEVSALGDESEYSGDVQFTNASLPICVNMKKIGEEWKVSNLAEDCE